MQGQVQQPRRVSVQMINNDSIVEMYEPANNSSTIQHHVVPQSEVRPKPLRKGDGRKVKQ